MDNIVFSGGFLDRRGDLRRDPERIEALLHQPETRFLPVWRGQCLVAGEHVALLPHDDVAAYLGDPQRCTLLGVAGDGALFGVSIDADARPSFGDHADFTGLRELTTRLAAPHAALAAYARAMIAWQDRHRHCGVCGAPNRLGDAGFVMQCGGADCDHRSFPRLDPAIIVLVRHEDRCLLGRKAEWDAGRFSTIAGFVEPGESLEDALRREVREETGVEVGACRYLGSQPWPFPAALMIGFHAEAMTTAIACNDDELEEARWLSRQQVIDGEIVLPPRISIAYRLIESWFDDHDGPSLASFELAAPPLRVPRPVD